MTLALLLTIFSVFDLGNDFLELTGLALGFLAEFRDEFLADFFGLKDPSVCIEIIF